MAGGNEEEIIDKKTFEQKWLIKDFLSVLQNQALVENTKTEIHCKVENVEIAKFIVFTKMHQDNYGTNHYVGLWCQLVYKQDRFVNVKAQIVATTPKTGHSFQKNVDALLETPMEICAGWWYFNKPSGVPQLVNSEGSLEINLKLTITNISNLLYDNKTEQFRKLYKDEFGQSFKALLDNKNGSDVKIVTKENTEFLAHRIILCARCPVLAAMFESDFRENSTGVVNVNDISAKTMKIILEYWYTGELSSSWKDNDNIVEFAYAAGKYQMTWVLKMLDDLLGYDFKTENSDGELLQLLKIVGQLSLKRAETRILKLILSKVSRAVGGAGLLDLFPLPTDNIEKESFDILQVINSVDEAFAEGNYKASSLDVKLMALSCKFGKKTVETKLVQRIKGTVAKMTSADELFALFDVPNKMHEDDSKQICLFEPTKNQDVVDLVKN